MEFSATKSMFGPQVSSQKPSFAAYGFGTSGRTSSTKLFHTKEQTASNVGLESPGPIYDMPSAVGLQNSSKNETAPSFKFGARSLSDSNLAKESRPGPGTYVYEGSLGKQSISQRSSASAWRFGSSNRWANFNSDFKHNYQTPGSDFPRPAKGWLGDAAMFSFGTSGRHVIGMGNPGSKPSFQTSPGPGTYTAPSSLGAQMPSQRGTASQFKFGTATRDSSQKVYLTHSHEREYVGQHSPAPNCYNIGSSIGMQCTSRNTSAPTIKFGSADRFSELRPKATGLPIMNPGPGSYGV